MKELITVVVPVYKVEPYLTNCLDSIVRQTYQNLEIILVDDGSPDSCPAICDAWAKKDGRIKVIHKANGGLSSARNAAIDAATGDYLAFVDSDDYVGPLMLENLYNGLVRHNADICISGHYAEKDGRLIMEDPPIDAERCLTSKVALAELIEDVRIRNYAWDKLYKKSLFEGIRYPVGRNYEDIATTYLLFDRAQRVCQVPGYHYYYQIRESGISHGASEEKWMLNRMDIVASMRERHAFFEAKGETALARQAMAQLVPAALDQLNLQYRLVKRRAEVERWKSLLELRAFLAGRREEIEQNDQLQGKYKKLVAIYTAPQALPWLYARAARLKKRFSPLQRLLDAVNRRRATLPAGTDFSLRPDKTRRIIFFELPCFDNLGDHAICYATKRFLDDLAAEHPGFQVYYVDGWDTVPAVKALKRVIHGSDILVLHGGGNLGDLYPFAEAFRHKVVRAFPQNPIFLFPQTMFFSDSATGKKALEKSRRFYNRCTNLTLFARDAQSFILMKQYYRAQVYEMKDIVAYLDESGRRTQKNSDLVVLCLRSDGESALGTEDKKRLEAACRSQGGRLLVTDTISKELDVKTNQDKLQNKWNLFATARLVLTDRLHGMVFSLITATPCIVVGNNHFKVEKTYETFRDCPYLYYLDDLAKAEQMIAEVMETPMPPAKTDYAPFFEQMKSLMLAQPPGR